MRRQPRFDHRPFTLEDRTVPSAAGMISGNVFYDNNGDLFKSGTDYNVPGATIALTGTTNLGNSVTLSTTTTAAGTFQFLKLEPGTYQVSASIPTAPSAVAGLGNLGGSAVGNQVQTIILSQGQTDANLRFDELCHLLQAKGFRMRVSGSHHIFTRTGVMERINIQREGAKAKPYQVRQVRRILATYKLL